MIRRLALDDPRWRKMADTYFPREAAPADLAKLYDAPPEFTILGIEGAGGRLMAFMWLVDEPRERRLHMIVVDEEFRLGGLGRVLVRLALDTTPRPVVLSVNAANKGALVLFQGAGFKMAGDFIVQAPDGQRHTFLTMRAVIEGRR